MARSVLRVGILLPTGKIGGLRGDLQSSSVNKNFPTSSLTPLTSACSCIILWLLDLCPPPPPQVGNAVLQAYLTGGSQEF